MRRLQCMFVISCFVSLGKGDIHTKLALLKERMHTLERRLSEDISFLRKDLYSEISSAKSTSAASLSDPNTKITEDDIDKTDVMENIEQLKDEIFSRLDVLHEAIRAEKVYRRDLQKQMGLEQRMSSEAVNSLTQIDDTIETKLDALKLPGLMPLLQDIKELLRETTTFKPHDVKFRDCSDLLRSGQITSGIYEIHPDTIWRPLKVYCDMTTEGGGWTVFQRRCDGSENFYRSWNDYRFGFGNLSSEFWLGNEYIYRLTNAYPQELRIELEDFDDDRRYARYEIFEIKSVTDLFQIHLEDFNGNVTDSLTPTHNGRQFSTFDKGPSSSCSKQFKGGFWYNACHGVNINGQYLKGEHTSYADGVNWSSFRGGHYSLKRTEMKFRPK